MIECLIIFSRYLPASQLFPIKQAADFKPKKDTFCHVKEVFIYFIFFEKC